MINKLKVQRIQFGVSSLIGSACTAAIVKLEEYCTLATSQRESHSVIATICDPRLNWNVFNILWNSTGDELKKRRARKQWEECYYQYSVREKKLIGFRIQALSEIDAIQEVEDEPDSEDELYVTKGNPIIESEWVRWMK
jgi:hypothetical protein